MKFGKLIIDLKNTVNKTALNNRGDNIQVIALDNLYQYMGIDESEIVEINMYDLPTYDGEYVLLPINCYFWTCDERFYFIPTSSKIIPVFLGVHFSFMPTTPYSIHYLQRFEPIGCRDFTTMKMLQQNNIHAYLNGCLTATLPQRQKEPLNGKAFLVDVPESLFPYIPKEIMDNSEIISHEEHFNNDITGGFMNTTQLTNDLISQYKNEASLIITSRLHCASPCMAMGIPVIIVRETYSNRFEWINKFLPIYFPDDFANINWFPEKIEYEEFKQTVLRVNASRIRETFERYNDICKISEFYEDAQNKEGLSFANRLNNSLKKDKCEVFDYIIWGAGYMGETAYNTINSYFDNARLVAVVDEYLDCEFHGISTIRSSKLTDYPNAIVIIATASGYPVAKQLLDTMGRKQGTEYFATGTFL